MWRFSIFKNRSNTDDEANIKASETRKKSTKTDKSKTKSQKKRKEKSAPRNKLHPLATNSHLLKEEGAPKSYNEKCVEKAFAQINKRQLPDALCVGATLETFGQQWPLTVFFDGVDALIKSFEDYRMQLLELHETESGDVRAVYVAGGHHTGLPFQTPRCTTPLQPTGTYAQIDPEECIFTMRGGKIASMKVTPLGKITGFDGMYEVLLNKASKQQSKH